MNRCPITYEPCQNAKYSQKGLTLLSRRLKQLNDFPYTAKEQLLLAAEFAGKLSIQGVQPKLSASLNISTQEFEIKSQGGLFILKPPHPHFDELPQNEDLTMRLAQVCQIEIPLHGMIYNIDNSLTYFIKRFDRLGKTGKVAVEDFSQLLGFSRETKYESSMEQVITVLVKHCTFPVIEKLKLFRLVLFNFIVGNEDLHLKNFTLIRRQNKVELSPSYDLVNSTLVLATKEEIALPIRGKKNKLNRKDLIDYFGKEKLGLSEVTLKKELFVFETAMTIWKILIEESFLSEKYRDQYQKLILERWDRIKEL